MLDIGGWEFLIVAFVLLMVVGPKDLPKLLRGFTKAIRQIRSMASEFTRGMEDLASESELGDLKNTISDVKTGNLSGIADKIDPEGDLKDSVSELKQNSEIDAAKDELVKLKDVGDETGKHLTSNAPLEKPQKEVTSEPRKKS